MKAKRSKSKRRIPKRNSKTEKRIANEQRRRKIESAQITIQADIRSAVDIMTGLVNNVHQRTNTLDDRLSALEKVAYEHIQKMKGYEDIQLVFGGLTKKK